MQKSLQIQKKNLTLQRIQKKHLVFFITLKVIKKCKLVGESQVRGGYDSFFYSLIPNEALALHLF